VLSLPCARAVAGGIGIFLLAGCLTTNPVSYRRDVYPILKANCLSCHRPPDGEGYLQTQLSMASYRSLMQGTRYGPVILPGDSRKSIFNMLVEGRADASLRMPLHRKTALTAEEIETLKLWVDQGARDN
jgi:uncharacterized membrane protein